MTASPSTASMPITHHGTPFSTVCGQLLMVGFEGGALPSEVASALSRGERGGIILFKRNVTSMRGGDADVEQIAALNAAIVAAAPSDLPPLIGVDQEGGRVRRIGPPALQLPPMRALGDTGDLDLISRAARTVGSELAALGFSINFAPVLDVSTNPDNPVIGDRAFGVDPRAVMRAGVAYLRGLQSAGVLACGKHFPGHGDTELDSHLALPRVTRARPRLDEAELPPFRAAIGAGVGALMTAHVVYDALDAGAPATLSRAVVGSLLRAELGFEGICISDDLLMKGISPSGGDDVDEVAFAAVEAVAAGCDVVLVSAGEGAIAAAHAALVRRAESDERFRRRCVESFERSVRVRRLAPPRPVVDAATLREIIGGAASRAVAAGVETAVARAHQR